MRPEIWYIIGATVLITFFLWRRFRPVRLGVIGFKWNTMRPLFEEAALVASAEVGRRIKVVPRKSGVALLVAHDISVNGHSFHKPIIRLTLDGRNDKLLVREAIGKAVSTAELRRSWFSLW
jgi:hypothetical protein